MPKLTILRGVAGSGKSTWARAQVGSVVVSRDDLRDALFGSSDQDYYDVPKNVLFAKEDAVSLAEAALIKAMLAAGKDVIADSTHTMVKYTNRIAKIGWQAGADVELKVFDVALKVAVERNGLRAKNGGRNVPADTIKRQHDQLQGSKNYVLIPPPPVKPYSGTPGKPKAFMVDIDGTLAHMLDKRGPFDWASVHLDEPDEVVVDIVNVLASSNFAMDLGYYKVIVMSGRDAVCRPETEKWLGDFIQYDHLFMRPEGDMRADNIVKAELFDKHVRDNFDVQFVLDDRDQVVDMWRRMGLKCLQVEPGAF